MNNIKLEISNLLYEVCKYASLQLEGVMKQTTYTSSWVRLNLPKRYVEVLATEPVKVA
jgi:hypothetical protein